MLIAKLHELLYDNREPVRIERIKVEHDPRVVQDIQSKIERAKEWLGDKYCCHPDNQVRRLVKERKVEPVD